MSRLLKRSQALLKRGDKVSRLRLVVDIVPTLEILRTHAKWRGESPQHANAWVAVASLNPRYIGGRDARRARERALAQVSLASETSEPSAERLCRCVAGS